MKPPSRLLDDSLPKPIPMNLMRWFFLFLFTIFLIGCLQTSNGGCGGPIVGEPCECRSDTAPMLASSSEIRPVINDSTPQGGTLVIHADVEPPHLLCLLRPDSWCERIVNHDVYEALLRRNPLSYTLEPELAESYEISDDNRTITFRLRPGVLWHDGEPFTSDDVVFTFDTVRDPAVLAPTARANLDPIASYEALDDFTFVVRLREPSFFLLNHLESTMIIPRHIFEQGDINTHTHLRRPVGTGPFRVTKYRSGREVVLERNEHYWGRHAQLDRLIYRFVRDRTLALQMLRRGDLDLVSKLTNAQVDQIRADEELLGSHQLQTFIAPGFSFIALNTQRQQFEDRRVRQAFALLIDRQTILCAIDSCFGKIISSPFPVGHPGIDPDIEPWPFDPARARALLDEAGWRRPGLGGIRRKDGRPLRVTFLIPTVSTDQQRIATFIQQDMARVGIRLDIHNVDWSVFLERIQDQDFDLAGLQFSMDWETDYYTLYHSSQDEGGMNYGAFNNEEVDTILEALRREFDVERRTRLYRRLHRILHEEQPHLFMFARVVTTLTNKSVRNAIPGIPWFDERLMYIAEGKRGKNGRPIQ